jgi:phospholipase/carboxylesterase
MIHFFRKIDLKQPTFLLLHGTGGDEHDLVPLAHIIDPTYNILSVRGDVNERGMNRFFKRLSEGIFDEPDLIYRTHQLKAFIDQASLDYGFDRSRVIALGYSNGANIAASLLFHYEDALSKALLFHPVVPLRKVLPDLKQVSVFISAGKNDPLCDPSITQELADLLTNAHVSVSLHWENGGHQLTETEVHVAKTWLKGK